MYEKKYSIGACTNIECCVFASFLIRDETQIRLKVRFIC